jgi:hypothetical protein
LSVVILEALLTREYTQRTVALDVHVTHVNTQDIVDCF